MEASGIPTSLSHAYNSARRATRTVTGVALLGFVLIVCACGDDSNSKPSDRGLDSGLLGGSHPEAGSASDARVAMDAHTSGSGGEDVRDAADAQLQGDANELDAADGVHSDSGGALPDASLPDSGMPGAALSSCRALAGWSWSDLYPTASAGKIVSLWGASATDVWEARGIRGYLHHFDGNLWTDVPVLPGNTFTALFGTSASDVWAVASAGVVAHWDGNVWSCSTPRPTTANLTTVWASGPNDVWTAGTGTDGPSDPSTALWHWNGVSWRLSYQANVTLVWGSGPTDVWAAVGNGGVTHWDGNKWSDVLAVGSGAVASGWSDGGNDALIVSGGAVYSWNGSSWARGVSANALWAISEQDIWLSTANETRHIANGSTQTYQVGGDHLVGTSASNIWLYGPGGKRSHWNGAGWSDESSTLTATTRGVGFQKS